MKYSRQNIARLEPYVPGYQPDRSEKVIKLNTNENPYPPSPLVLETIKAHTDESLRLYPPPGSDRLREVIAEVYGVQKEQIICGNGNDELIAMVFRTFVEPDEVALFPYPTYSYYKTSAEINNCRYQFIDTEADFQINLNKFLSYPSKLVMLANPNAPTGLLLPVSSIQEFVKQYNGVLAVDETYIDFAGSGSSALPLIDKYDNILILRTVSKSFSLCGIRLGYAFGAADLIGELQKCKESYNVSYLTQIAGISAFKDYAYMEANTRQIAADRQLMHDRLRELGFEIIPSQANFLFVTHARFQARWIYEQLQQRGIYVRYFDGRRVSNYLRITIGKPSENEQLCLALKEILA